MTTLAETNRSETAPLQATSAQRLMSLDALRGFDMFWIIGAESIVYALHQLTPNKATTLLADQLEHVPWQGFHFYDLIFPLFVFIAGVSLVFSLSKTIETVGRGEALKRVFRRGILLFVIGILYSSGFARLWPDMRLMGVLNRIALAYLFAGLLFCFLKPRALAGVCLALLIGYWALLTFVPIRDIQLTKSSLAQRAEDAGDSATAALFRAQGNPSAIKNSPAWAAARTMFNSTTNYVRGKYDAGMNLSDHFDFQYLPGRKYDTFYDPEGVLSTIPAVATCLLGAFAGLLLKNPLVRDRRKVALLFGFGLAGVVLGCVWGIQFPIVKKIWTSSFVLLAGGCSSMLLGLFYLVVDVWRVRGWCQPLVWMGMNSITVYLASNIIGGFEKLATRFAGGDISAFLDRTVAKGAGEFVVATVGLLLAFWFVRFLYCRKVFLRL